MKRKKPNWSKLARDAFKLGATANAVIALRLAKLALGGAGARTESERMIREKLKTAADANRAAVLSALRGDGHLAPERAMAVYQKRVSKNLKRLSKKSYAAPTPFPR